MSDLQTRLRTQIEGAGVTGDDAGRLCATLEEKYDAARLEALVGEMEAGKPAEEMSADARQVATEAVKLAAELGLPVQVPIYPGSKDE